MGDQSGVAAAASRGERRRVDVALFVFVLAALGPWIQMFTAQPRSRFLMTQALAEEGTFDLTSRAEQLSADKVEFRGRVLGDKAPGQPVLSVPVYWSGDALGIVDRVEKRQTDCCLSGPFVAEFHLGAWWLGLFVATLPTAGLAVLMYRRAQRSFPDSALSSTLGLIFGTLLLPYGTRLYGHALTAFLCYASWSVLDDDLAEDGESTAGWRHLVAGFLASLAIAVEYLAGLFSVLVVIFALAGRRFARAVVFVLAHVPVGVMLAWYHVHWFGSPFRTSYSVKTEQALQTGQQVSRVGIPDPGQALEIVFGTKGLVYTPLVLLAVWGIICSLRAGARVRREALMAAAMLGGYFLLQAGWPNPWGGESPGPRYMIPALPFLAIPLASLDRVRMLWLATAVGFVPMSLATVTAHHIPFDLRLVTGQLRMLHNYGPSLTVYGFVFGDSLGRVAAVLVAGACAVVLALAHGGRRRESIRAASRISIS